MGLGGYPGWACVFFSLLITIFFFCILLCVWFFFLNHLSIFDFLRIEWFFHIWCFRSTVDINFFLLLIFFHLVTWHYFLSWVSWFSLMSFLLGYLDLITWPISLVGWPEQTCVFFCLFMIAIFLSFFLLIIFFKFHHSTFD